MVEYVGFCADCHSILHTQKRRRGEARSNEQWVIRRNKVINVARVEQEQAVDYNATSQDQSLGDPPQGASRMPGTRSRRM